MNKKYITKLEEVKKKAKDIIETESMYYLYFDDGVKILVKPYTEEKKKQLLIDGGFPVEVVRNLDNLNTNMKNYRLLHGILTEMMQKAEVEGIKQVIKKTRMIIEGPAGTGKTTMIAKLLSVIWDYNPYVSFYYTTPYDSDNNDDENYKKRDILIIDNVNGEEKLMHFSFDAIRRIKELIFHYYDTGKGIVVLSNDGIEKLQYLGEPIIDRLKPIIRINDKSYRQAFLNNDKIIKIAKEEGGVNNNGKNASWCADRNGLGKSTRLEGRDVL